MTTQVIWGTFAKVTGGLSGTAPEIFVGCTDQTAAVITTAGAVSDLYSFGQIKTGDVIFVNGDQDGTPFYDVYKVTSTSGGSLVVYLDEVGALLAANNLSDLVSASTARTNMGVAIGSNVQAYNAALASIAGLTTSADKMIYATASNVYATADLSSFARTVLDDTTAGAARTTLGAQAQSNILAAQTADIGGGGAGPIDVTVASMTGSSVVVASISSSSNTVSIAKVHPQIGKFSLTFSGDPGAACIVNYVAFIAPQ